MGFSVLMAIVDVTGGYHRGAVARGYHKGLLDSSFQPNKK